jgi:hypothetical protein
MDKAGCFVSPRPKVNVNRSVSRIIPSQIGNDESCSTSFAEHAADIE